MLHAQWHHAIACFGWDDPFKDFVKLLGWRAKTLADQGHRETAAALQSQFPVIHRLWQNMTEDGRRIKKHAEEGDIIYQHGPQVDPADAPAFAKKCRSDLARMRGDVRAYRDFLDKIHQFSAAIIPAWESTPAHEDRDYVPQLRQAETIATDTFRKWLAALDALESLLPPPAKPRNGKSS